MSDVQALEVLLKTPVNYKMLQCLVNATLKVLPCPEESYPSPSADEEYDEEPRLPSLFTFITKLVKGTNIYTGTLMSTMVYLKRLHERLPAGAVAQDPSTRHRIFLACLILSSKFHNDTSPKNKHWSRFTDGLFEVDEVNEMERQLLLLLDWDILVSVSDLISVLSDLLAPIKEEINNIAKLQSFLDQQRQEDRPPTPKKLDPPVFISPMSRPSKLRDFDPSSPDSLSDLHPISLQLSDERYTRSFSSIHLARSLNNNMSSSTSSGSLSSSLTKSSSISSIFSETADSVCSCSPASEEFFLQPVDTSGLFPIDYQMVTKTKSSS